MHSRLSEVVVAVENPAAARPPTEENGVAASDSMKGFFKQVEAIKVEIRTIRNRTQDVTRLQEEALNAVRAEDSAATTNELEKVLADANKRCTAVKQLLTTIHAENESLQTRSDAPASEIRIRNNMYQAMTQNFVQAVRNYQSAQHVYQAEMKTKVARQVRIVKPDATLEEIDTAMKSGDTGAVYRAAILQPGADPVAIAYQDCQAKYRDVLKLEESVRALNQLFRDLALLVEQQGEMLNQIEYSVEEAAEHVKGGNENLRGALKARKSIRKKYLIIALIATVVIVLLIVFLVK